MAEHTTDQLADMDVSQKLNLILLRLDAMTKTIEELGEGQKETMRTLRGFNGTPGLITQVALLESTVKTTEAALNTKLAEHVDKQELEKKSNITLAWVLEKIVIPIGTSVAVAALVALIVSR